MMVLHRGCDGWRHGTFLDLPELLPPDAVLVVNNTRVLPRRLVGTTGLNTIVEALLIEEPMPGRWVAMVRRARRIKPGAPVSFAQGALKAIATERTPEGYWVLEFTDPVTLPERLERHGLAPLPPYIGRPGASHDEQFQDRERYQTLYARVDGALAAPTAGLHFTPAVLGRLRARGIPVHEITLHVGIGTFAPVKTADPATHVMHAERYEITSQVAKALITARNEGRPIIAVGTTTVRTLETWALGGFLPGVMGETRLFIYPPFEFRTVHGMLTNFHLPKSTLLMLVSAFHGRERVLAAYREAVDQRYRFFSFGDCMLILPAWLASAGPHPIQ
jgi:S-adenosylmethionine:tRNA ribosyltransferase-isomerase